MTTLYKLNSFNEISWWHITHVSVDTTHSIQWSWGNQLPMTETANVEVEDFDSLDKCMSALGSKINHMINRKGYSEEVPNCAPSLPMLCKEYKEPPTWNDFALQPKLDGIRCILSQEGMRTRTNLLITSCPQIDYYCKQIPEGIKLDGELYIDNVPMNMIESLVMQRSATDSSKLLKFHMFDCIDLEAPFSARIEEVQRIHGLFENLYFDGRTSGIKHPAFTIQFPFQLVPTVIYEDVVPPYCPTHTDKYPTPKLIKEAVDEIVQDYFKDCIGAGYEGCIVRRLDAGYEPNKRSSNILKLKEFFDDEFKIIDVVEGKGKTAIFVCENHAGSEEFRCNFKATDAVKKQMLVFRKNYIGKWLRIEHEGMYDNGKPRCPVGIHVFEKKNHD